MENIDFSYRVCEITAKYSRIVPDQERSQATGSKELARLFYDFYEKDTIELTESCYAMMLNAQLKVLGIVRVGVGSSDMSIIDHRKILQAALLCNGLRVALCHNHPSYHLNPSAEDRQSTRKLSEACSIMGFRLIDHIILDPDGNYYSFADNGEL